MRWPSFAVFTDLRLDSDYIEAQKYRMQSGQVYGNFVTIARTTLNTTKGHTKSMHMGDFETLSIKRSAQAS